MSAATTNACSSEDLMAFAHDYIEQCRAGDPTAHIKPVDRSGHLRIERLEGFVPDVNATPNSFGETGSIDLFEARCDCGRTILVSGVNWRLGRAHSCGLCDLTTHIVADMASVHGGMAA